MLFIMLQKNSFGLVFILQLLQYHVTPSEAVLSVCGTNLCDRSTPVFLSGMNQAWENFGYDFGNGGYDNSGLILESDMQNIKAAGGNSIRIWIHTDGRDTPNFDSDGFVVSLDRDGTFIEDISSYLDTACEQDIYVFLVLWNGATYPTEELLNLFWDENKLQSYIDNALVPLVNAIKDKPALGGWEIINEPEGSVRIEGHEDPCLDTMLLEGSGAGWTGANIPMENILKFINWQIDAIKSIDSNELNTIGSWSERSQTDNFGWRNYYTDECLRAPQSSRFNGVIDFYQMHSYAWEGSYSQSSPMLNPNSVYGIDDKPNVLGEYSQAGGDGRDITELIRHAFDNGYDGAWSWHANEGGAHSDDFATQARALESIAGQTNDEGKTTDVQFC